VREAGGEREIIVRVAPRVEEIVELRGGVGG
jgi:hypothetical protein